MLEALRRIFHRLRWAAAKHGPVTIAGRRPVVFSHDELESLCARRKATRSARSDAAAKGWSTRRGRPDLGEGRL